jgi:transcriptional regulator of acetoin/glycerol metabolism
VDGLPDEVVVRAAGSPSGAAKSGYFQLRKQKVDGFEKEYLKTLLEGAAGDTSAAATAADLPRGTLYRLLKKHGLRAEDFRS